ncbi:MAG: GNAT family N-acetyltransferase [Betaproteobacteria bacterium]
MPPFLNLLEPRSLVANFQAFPPAGFAASTAPHGLPVFQTNFDLLTTADDQLRRRVTAMPFYEHWRRLLNPRTCFVGTTVTEYALFPETVPAPRLVADLKSAYAREYPFLIVKDIPQASPLIDDAGNAYADKVVAASLEAGFILLQGQALAYVPIDFDSVDTYLSRLSAGRRKDIRRKLRGRSELDIQRIPTGDAFFADETVLQQFYALYLNVYQQSELHFDLLTPEFFKAMLQSREDGGVVFVYRHNGSLIGYNVCYVKEGRLIDKYIGLLYPQARDFNLYFVSWFQNLEYALAEGLKHYVAGWTDPQIKAEIGASFTFTRHAVHVRNPLLRAVLRRLAGHFENDRSWSEKQA